MARGAPLSLHDLALCLRPVARARARGSTERPAGGVEGGRARRRAADEGERGGARQTYGGRRRAASRARATAGGVEAEGDGGRPSARC